MGIDVKRAVFLDRDGVLNQAIVRDGKAHSPASLEELAIAPDAAAALARLKERGFLLLVVTNQPEVARGTLSHDTLERMHAVLRAALPIDKFFVCYHDDIDACGCRKPKPGLLLEAAREFGVDLSASFMVGDRWKDVDAGRNAGCIPVWIDRGYAERGPSEPPAATVASLTEAAEWILRQ